MAKADLKPVRSKDEAKERGRKGGIASGRARRQKRTLREALEEMLSMPCGTDPKRTNQSAIAVSMMNEAIKGNVRAFEVIRDTIGEKPADKVNHTSPDGSMSPAPGVVLDLSKFSFDQLLQIAGQEAEE